MALTYTEAPLNRATALRRDSARVRAMLTGGAARIVPVWNQRHLIDAAPRAQMLSFAEASRAFEADALPLIFLGVQDEVPFFALGLPGSETPPAMPVPGAFEILNDVVALLPGDEAAILAYARAMVIWHFNHRHCGRCGAPAALTESGHSSSCTNAICGHRTYPRSDPVVITLITHGDACLLGRQAAWPPGMYSCIAGFVEPGENLEAAVKRECFEETGATLDEVRYVASQPWPFPASMMLGFHASATTRALQPRDDELEDCRWFTKNELALFGERSDPGPGFKLPNRYAIARLLIDGWRQR